MNYDPIGWVNDAPPRLNAPNLNHMDAGIKAAHDAIDALADIGTSGPVTADDVDSGDQPVGRVLTTDGSGGAGWTVPSGGEAGGGTSDHSALLNRALPDQHPIGAITGLQAALDGKQPSGSYAPATHTHDDRYYTEAEVNTALAGKAAAAHNHDIGDVANLWETLGGKAEASHTHTIGDVTGLQAALGEKADASHDHEGQFQPRVLVFSDEGAVLAALSSGQVAVGDIVAVED